MAKKVTMTFWRDDYSGPACLEYSWVPEGLRRNIQLMPGQQEDTSTDSVNDNLNPSHVEVYVVTNNDAASIERWQFPSGGPGKTPIAFARVEIYQERLEIVGTVAYEDGSTVIVGSTPQPGVWPLPLASFGARSYKHNVVIAPSPLWETPCGAPPVAHAIPAPYEKMGLESGPSETGVLRTRLPVRYWPATGRPGNC